MDVSFARSSAIVLLLIGVSFTATAAGDEAVASVAGDELTLTVDSPRPVAAAVDELSIHQAVFITYEDPPYEYQADLRDVTESVQRYVPPGNPKKRIIVPKGGRFTMNAPASDVAEILGRLLDANVKAGIGAHFKAEKDGDVYHVIPTEVRDVEGNWKPVSSILDGPITLEPEERTAGQTLQAICAAIQAQNYVRVIGAVDPVLGGLGPQPRFQIGAKDEVARNVLLRALKEMRKNATPLTWALYYGDSSYVLNLRPVQKSVTRD